MSHQGHTHLCRWTSYMAASTTASQEELKAHRIPLAWRDQCSSCVVTLLSWLSYADVHASSTLLLNMLRSTPICQQSFNDVHFALESTYASLLIPLNLCRKQKLYKPWECEHERHTYDKYVYTVHYTLYVDLLCHLSTCRCQYDE